MQLTSVSYLLAFCRKIQGHYSYLYTFCTCSASVHTASPIQRSCDDTLDTSSLSWSDDDRPVTPTYMDDDVPVNKSTIEPKNLMGVSDSLPLFGKAKILLTLAHFILCFPVVYREISVK